MADTTSGGRAAGACRAHAPPRLLSTSSPSSASMTRRAPGVAFAGAAGRVSEGVFDGISRLRESECMAAALGLDLLAGDDTLKDASAHVVEALPGPGFRPDPRRDAGEGTPARSR
jgi:hypothetical protein